MRYLGDLIEFAKKLVQHVDKFARRAIAGQTGEANNIGIQNTVRNSNTLDSRRKHFRYITKLNTYSEYSFRL